jgi:hypothetical protein
LGKTNHITIFGCNFTRLKLDSAKLSYLSIDNLGLPDEFPKSAALQAPASHPAASSTST